MPAFNSVAKFSVAKPAAALTVEFAAEHGTFALTGQATLFQVQHALEHGVFSLTGQDTVFQVQFALEHGTFTLSGQTAVLDAQFQATAGNFALTGQDTAFQVQIAAGYGSFVLSGQDILFTVSLGLGTGSFVLSGQDALLYESTLEPGIFVLTGFGLPETFRDIATGQFFPAIDERGYDLQDTLGLFAAQHRRETEERDLIQLMELENRIIAKAFKPFLGMKDAA